MSIISSFGWAFAERFATQISSFIVSLVLARLLDPSVYGLLAMANSCIAIINAATLTGFGTRLIQKKDATDVDFSSTLIISFCVGLVAYAITFALAPSVSRFFGNTDLVKVIRVLGLILVSSSICIVQRAYITRKMQFKLFFFSSLVTSVVSAIIGILLAYYGFGIWALVAQTLTKSITDIIVIAFVCDWKPSFSFSVDSVKDVCKFGWKIVISSIADALYGQSRSIIVGKFYTASDLAYYDKGLQFPNLVVTNIDTTIANVLVPVLSKAQDDLPSLKKMVRVSLRMSSYIIFPLLIGMMVCAPSIVEVFLSSKWMPSVPYMRLLCFALMFRPLQTANLQGVIALGRSDTYLKITIVQKLTGVAVLIASVLLFDSPVAIAASEIVAYLFFELILIFPNISLLHYSVFEKLHDIVPQLLFSLIMGLIVWFIGRIQLSNGLILILQILIGALCYYILSFSLKPQGWLDIVQILKSIKEERKNA